MITTQGLYGERIFENIKKRAPKNWVIVQSKLPKNLPEIIEVPEIIIEKITLSQNKTDLIIFIGENPSAFSLLPTLLAKINVKAVIVPVDDYSWLPKGLENQIKFEIERLNIKIVFPRPFCALVPINVLQIDEFIQYFGAPSVKINTSGKKVECVEVERGAPCGSTWYMSEKLFGVNIHEAGSRAGTLVQIFPCLASRKIDPLLQDAPIHIAGHIAKKAVEKSIKEHFRC